MSTVTDAPPDRLMAALQLAMQTHQAGELDEAEQIYREVLSQAPRQADALHLLGVLHAQRRQWAAAQDLLEQAIAANPAEAMFYNNLGNVHVERQQIADAESMYAKALELDGGRLDALSNLGMLLGRTGRHEDAERLLRQAVELAPDNQDWRQNLVNLYLRLGRQADALQQCHDGLLLAPDSRELRALLVRAYTHQGLIDRALQVLREWVKDSPDDAHARHHLAALSGEQVPERADDLYVAHLFDRFASSFDANLADLSYKAPEWVAQAVARRVGDAHRNLMTLDAGCGTGLCGALLAPYASRLVGVDLSVGMLRRAADRGCYTDLFKGELVTFLLHSGLKFELIVSADTLCYFGNLQPFADAAKLALQPGGALVFTVEALGGQAPETGYRLHTHGRYSHSDNYVRATLQGAGLDDVTLQAVVLRNEGDTPVDGWLVSALAPRGH